MTNTTDRSKRSIDEEASKLAKAADYSEHSDFESANGTNSSTKESKTERGRNNQKRDKIDRQELNRRIDMTVDLMSKTGLDMSICEDALEETDYDMRRAIHLLQAKGLAGKRFRPKNVAIGLGLIAFAVLLFVLVCGGVWGDWYLRIFMFFGESGAVMMTKGLVGLVCLLIAALGIKVMISIEKD